MADWARARKDYECFQCGKTIHKGTTYVRRQNLREKRTELSHHKCFIYVPPGHHRRQEAINP